MAEFLSRRGKFLSTARALQCAVLFPLSKPLCASASPHTSSRVCAKAQTSPREQFSTCGQDLRKHGERVSDQNTLEYREKYLNQSAIHYEVPRSYEVLNTLKYSGPANLVQPNVYSEIVAAAALASLVQVGHAAAAAARSPRGDA